MHRFARERRGLAEIVGTLMLVVIVVAAATAFSFFVAAYEKQLQTNETLNHNRALEAVKVIGVDETTCTELASPATCPAPCESTPGECFALLSFVIASLDVNPIQITALFIDHDPVVNFSVQESGAPKSPCYNDSNLSNATLGVGTCAPVTLPAFGTLTLNLNLDEQLCTSGPPPPCTYPGYYALFGVPSAVVTSTSVITLQMLTGLGNEFTEASTPPSAVASVFFVSSGESPTPVFDGLDSYQPPSATNASILLYQWTIVGSATSDTCAESSPCYGSGAEFESPTLESGTYDVTLQVTNSDGLSGFASLTYTQS